MSAMSRARQQMARLTMMRMEERIDWLVQNLIDIREAGRVGGWSPSVLEDIERRAYIGLGIQYIPSNIETINARVQERIREGEEDRTREDASSVEIEPEERGGGGEGGGR